MNRLGENVDAAFRKGVQEAMQALTGREVTLAILQSRSPSCGVKQVYDGTFSGTLRTGRGLFAQALAEAGIPLMDAQDCPDA